MLWNETWSRTEKDVQNIKDLIAFIEKHDKNKPYSYTDGYACLLSQYYTAKYGVPYAVSPNSRWKQSKGLTPHSKKWPQYLDWIASAAGDGYTQGCFTFGNALNRAKRLLAEIE